MSGTGGVEVGRRTSSPSTSLTARAWPALGLLAAVAAIDALFLVGVLLPYLSYDGEFAVQWLPDPLVVPVVLTVFFLPWVTFGAAALSGYRLWRGPSDGSRGVAVAVVVLGVAGFGMYVSPWGIDAIRWLLD